MAFTTGALALAQAYRICPCLPSTATYKTSFLTIVQNTRHLLRCLTPTLIGLLASKPAVPSAESASNFCGQHDRLQNKVPTYRRPLLHRSRVYGSLQRWPNVAIRPQSASSSGTSIFHRRPPRLPMKIMTGAQPWPMPKNLPPERAISTSNTLPYVIGLNATLSILNELIH